MNRSTVLALCGALVVAACSPGARGPQLGPDGRPLPQRYQITDASAVSYRLLDSVNALRSARNAPALSFNAQLNAAAETHARDMSRQNRPWHFGSDGSSPLQRVQRAGYTGKLMGELISETYQTELETLADWMENTDTRAIVLDAAATEVGFAWFQEQSGKIWWTMVTGGPGSSTLAVAGL